MEIVKRHIYMMQANVYRWFTWLIVKKELSDRLEFTSVISEAMAGTGLMGVAEVGHCYRRASYQF